MNQDKSLKYMVSTMNVLENTDQLMSGATAPKFLIT